MKIRYYKLSKDSNFKEIESEQYSSKSRVRNIMYEKTGYFWKGIHIFDPLTREFWEQYKKSYNLIPLSSEEVLRFLLTLKE